MVPPNDTQVLNLSAVPAQCHRTYFQEQQKFEEGQVKEFKVSSDTKSKRFVLRAWGTFKLTYSGAPTFDEAGFLGRILNLIQVSDGNDTFKNIDPTIARRLAHLRNGKPPRRRYATGASKPAVPTAEMALAGAPITAPTSTYYVYFEEELPINLEDEFAYLLGKQVTLWNTSGNQAARVRVICGSLSNLAEANGAGTGVTWNDDYSINMEISAVETPDVIEDPTKPFWVLKETLHNLTVPSGSTGYGFQIPQSSGRILGMSCLVRDTSSAKKFSDTAIKRMRLIANNSRQFVDGSFQSIQAQNVESFGPADNIMASGRHSLQGFAFMNFRKNGDIVNSGIPIGALDSLILSFDSAGAGDSPSESGDIKVLLAIQELRPKIR